MKKLLLILSVLFFTLTNLFAQQDIRIMTYNLLNYDSNVNTSRNIHFREIINATQPDILVVEEIQNQHSVDAFLNNVLKSINTNYSAGNFIVNSLRNNFDDNENAIYLDTTKFQFISNNPIHTDLRDINEFKVVNKSSGDILIIFAVHLKASSGTTEENQRAAEVDSLRKVTDGLSANSDFIVVGDFNFYKSSEPGYTKLLDQTATGYFVDPINQPGIWHNDASFSFLHTQSTRTTQLPDGGSTGGLDDRFDFILVSQAVEDTGGIVYKSGTYKSFGNDGNHFNKSINEQPNDSVPTSVANALYIASDHLPVIATLQFPNVTGINDKNSSIPNSFSLSQNYPNPFNPGTVISFQLPFYSYVTLKIYDVLGKEITTLVNDEKSLGKHDVNFNAKNLTSGIYFYRIIATSGSNKFIQTKKMILLK